MDLNLDTIRLHIEETERKIEIIKNDINTYRYHISHDEREIKTLEWLLGQYKNALEKLENGRN